MNAYLLMSKYLFNLLRTFLYFKSKKVYFRCYECDGYPSSFARTNISFFMNIAQPQVYENTIKLYTACMC